jgi:hypothetical protein
VRGLEDIREAVFGLSILPCTFRRILALEWWKMTFLG